MTQLMLVGPCAHIIPPSGVRFRPIDDANGQLMARVAAEYFGEPLRCSAVGDESGVLEPLIDDVCDSQRRGGDGSETSFGILVHALVADCVPFACWSGADYRDLPLVCSWTELWAAVRRQTAVQPGDLWVRYASAKQR